MQTDPRRFDRRSALGLSGAAALTALISACSPSASQSSGPAGPAANSAGASRSASGSASSSASTTATPSAAPVELGGAAGAPTLTLWADSQYVSAFAAASKGFTQKYGANLKIQPFSFNDILTNFQKAGPTGNGPDLIDANIDWLGPLQQAGLVGSVDFGAKAASFDKRALTGWTVNGSPAGLPITIESLCVLRNPKLVSSPLTSWSDLSSVMRELVAKGVKYPLVIDNNAYVFIAVLTAFGGYCFKQTSGTYDIHNVGLDNSGSVDAFGIVSTAIKNKWTRSGIDADTVAKAFPAGEIGIHVTGPWQIPPYQAAKADFEIDSLPAGPAGPAVPWLSARGLLPSKASKNGALAQSFLTDYWAATTPMASFAKAVAKQSAWQPAQQSTDDATVKALTRSASTAEPIPSNPALQAFWPAVGDGLTLLFNGQSTAAKVAKNAQSAVAQAVKKQG